MDREWVLTQIGPLIDTILDQEDVTYWEYRRLVELLELLDAPLLGDLLERAAGSDAPDIQEVVDNYRSHVTG